MWRGSVLGSAGLQREYGDESVPHSVLLREHSSPRGIPGRSRVRLVQGALSPRIPDKCELLPGWEFPVTNFPDKSPHGAGQVHLATGSE